jgi:hypothetical protein
LLRWAVAFAAFVFVLFSTIVAAAPLAAPQVDTDQLIVRVRGPGVPPAAIALERGVALASRLSAQGGEPMTHHRVMGDGSHVMKLTRRMPSAAIEAFARRFDNDPDVVEILPDRIAFPALSANDPRYLTNEQWALSLANGINAPGAWDITTGSPDVIVGIHRHRQARPRPILAERWVGGYDIRERPRALGRRRRARSERERSGRFVQRRELELARHGDGGDHRGDRQQQPGHRRASTGIRRSCRCARLGSAAATPRTSSTGCGGPWGFQSPGSLSIRILPMCSM